MKKYKKVLSIAGSDSGGGAGIQADIKAISACGCYAMTAITAVTVQNTVGVRGFHVVPAEVVAGQIAAVLEDIGADAVKLGMLPTDEMIVPIAESLKKYRVRSVVMDPVMVATSGLLLFIVSFFVLTGLMFRNMGGSVPGGKEWVRNELRSMGKLSTGEKAVGLCFLIAAVLWFSGAQLRGINIDGWQPFKYLTDAVIAMGMGIVPFLIPVDRKGTMAMDWKTANEAISWDVLLLFGGGLSLASAIQHTGVAQLIGAQVAVLAGSPFPVVLFGVVFIVTFATGVTSNTALAAMMMPLLAAVANALGLPPQPILMGTALAASAAFILPISTPPNAIVFGTGKIKIADMFRAGILINFVAIFVITGVMLLLD